jgi:hypothetical protein
MRIVATVTIGLVCTALFAILSLKIAINFYDLLTRRWIDISGDEEERYLFWPVDWAEIVKYLGAQIAFAVALIMVMIYSTS